MRKSLRLRDYDYSANGAYFITVCTHERCAVLIGEMQAAAEREFLALPSRFSGLSLDCWIVMPDHLHAIVPLIECRSTLSAIVQAYKSLSTRAIKQLTDVGRVWQRGFYDRVVRNEIELAALREYVHDNPIVHAVRLGRSDMPS